MGSPLAIVRGSQFSYEFKAQAHRRNDGCTIHISFDTKYGGDGWILASSRHPALISFDERHFIMMNIDYSAIKLLLEKTGLSGDAIEFVKSVRDDDLIQGVNLEGLSDDEIAKAFKEQDAYASTDTVIFIAKHSGLSVFELTNKILSVVCANAEFDISQLSFHFEYDIEIDEETFKSYFTIDSDEEYTAKVNEQARLDKANVDVVKPKVLAKLEEVLYDYDAGNREFDLEELAEQIAECQSRVEAFDEIDDGDDDEFFSMCDEFAKDSTYIVHACDGGCSYDLIGEQKDEHVYSFEFGKYINTGTNRYTFVIIDGEEPLDIDEDSFKSSDAFALLAAATHCSVLELPHRLVGNGYKDFDKETLLSASDESEIYDWLDSNVYAGDIIDILEEEELIEVIVGEYSKTLEKFEIDFSDCFE